MKTPVFLLLLLTLIAPPASAQFAVTGPSGVVPVASAEDYATRAFQDAWDMNERTDLGWFTFGVDQPRSNLTGISVQDGVFSATPTNSDPSFWLLDTHNPGSAQLGKVGKRFPIDGNKYKRLLLRMRLASEPSAFPQGPVVGTVLWTNDTLFRDPIERPTGGFRESGPILVHPGWWIYSVDLSSLGTLSCDNGGGACPSWPGPPGISIVDSLRIDPTQYVESGAVQLDWARLVEQDTTAFQRPISWTPANQAVDVFLATDAACSTNLTQIARGATGGSMLFYVGGLPAGDYFVGVRRTTTSDALNCSSGRFRVAGVPTMSFLSPSEEGSADDFATVQLNNAWDMTSMTDVDHALNHSTLGLGTLPAETESGASLGDVNALIGVNVIASPPQVGDPIVYPLWSEARGFNYRIDADRYRILTVEMGVARSRDINEGSIARIVWKIADEPVENVSEDIILRHLDLGLNNNRYVMQTINLDMKALPTDAADTPSSTGWVNGTGPNPGIQNFRVDGHEFPQQTGYYIRRVKLAALERAIGSYQIRWTYNNPSGESATISFFYDADASGFNGSPAAGCQSLPPTNGAAGCTWNTAGVPPGTQYVYSETRSGGTLLNRAYAKWPIVVDPTFVADPPRIVLDKSTIFFGAINNGGALTSVTQPQQIVVQQIGAGAVTWTVTANRPWIRVTPASGSGTGSFAISIDNSAGTLPAVAYQDGTITVTASGATNSPQYVRLYLDIRAPGGSSPPFAYMDTPADGASNLEGAINVSGWALDDIEVQKVQIWRDPTTCDASAAVAPNGKIYIADAPFLAGARPDVEAAYPTTPLNYRAGWGMQILTNGLPDQNTCVPQSGKVGGNGTFRIYAILNDVEGHPLTLGPRTITVANAASIKPFGTIETPALAGTISGNPFTNFGWVLSRDACIPFDGSTIDVYVDGVIVGHPVYNQRRGDVETAFPGLCNTEAAVNRGAFGYFYLDTTVMTNGLHTMYWVATDDLGRTEGIGSRFFDVLNGGAMNEQAQPALAHQIGPAAGPDLGRPAVEVGSPVPLGAPVHVRHGYGRNTSAAPVMADAGGKRRIAGHGSHRLEVSLPEPKEEGTGYSGYLVADGRLRMLPAGSTLDSRNGVFYWQPGPGYIGTYDLAFVRSNKDGIKETIRIAVELEALQSGN